MAEANGTAPGLGTTDPVHGAATTPFTQEEEDSIRETITCFLVGEEADSLAWLKTTYRGAVVTVGSLIMTDNDRESFLMKPLFILVTDEVLDELSTPDGSTRVYGPDEQEADDADEPG